jgi:hypothetical protein
MVSRSENIALQFTTDICLLIGFLGGAHSLTAEVKQPF